MAQNGPGTPIGMALQLREQARKKMAGVSTPGKQAGPKPTPVSTPAPTGKLSRGERNNNPGNLEDGNFTRSQPGYIGSDGRFAKFKTPQDGENAQVNLLRKNYAGMSVAQIIQKYAPLGDNSEASVRNYIGYVASRAGVNPDAKLGDGHYQQVAAAMRAFETGKRGPLKFQPYGGQLTRAGSSGGTGGGGGNVPQINYQPSSVPGPSGRPNTGVDNQSNRIFGSSGVVEGQQREVESKAGSATAVLDNYMRVLQNSQLEQAKSTQEFTDAARQVNADMIAATNQVKDRVKPIFETRQRVLDQLTRIQDMDPISRSIRGFFDLNYNQDYLLSTSSRLGAIVKESMDIYEVMQGLHGDSIEELDRLHSIDTMMPKLREEQASEMVKGSMMQVQRAMDNLGITMEGVQNESQIIGAQKLARDDLIGRLDGPTVTGLLGQAEQNNGIVVFNGVPLSSQELRERGQQVEGYNIANQNARMALAAGEAELYDKNATRMMDYMTDGQIAEAVQNGGMYQGVQIPLAALQATQTARAQAKVESAKVEQFSSDPSRAAQAATDAVGYGQQLEARGASVFGNRVFEQETYAFNSQVVDITRKITEEIRGAKDPVTLGVLSQQLAQAKEAYGTAISQKVNRLVGGDQKSAGYVTSYLLGDQITPGAGADMMVHFAMNGGLPAAMQTSAFGANGMKVVNEVIETLKTRKGPNGSRLSDAAITAEAARLIANPATAEGKRFRAATVGLKYQTTFSNLPALARDGENRATHPFGEMKKSVFATISRNADVQGIAEIASRFNLDPNVFRTLRSGGKVEGVDPEIVKQVTSAATSQQIAAAQQRYLVAGLDQEPPISPRMTNSELMLDFLHSSQGQNALISADNRSARGGIGDWMAGSVGRGDLLNKFTSYTSGFESAVGLAESDSKVESAMMARTWRNDVGKRTLSILNSMPNITRGEAQTLTTAITTMMPRGTAEQQQEQTIKAPMRSEYAYQTSLTKTQLDFVDNQILNGKFDDPVLERIRKKAQGDWLAANRAANSWADVLYGYTN